MEVHSTFADDVSKIPNHIVNHGECVITMCHVCYRLCPLYLPLHRSIVTTRSSTVRNPDIGTCMHLYTRTPTDTQRHMLMTHLTRVQHTEYQKNHAIHCHHRFYTYKGLVTRIATVEQSSLRSRKLNCYVKSEECNCSLMLLL